MKKLDWAAIAILAAALIVTIVFGKNGAPAAPAVPEDIVLAGAEETVPEIEKLADVTVETEKATEPEKVPEPEPVPKQEPVPETAPEQVTPEEQESVPPENEPEQKASGEQTADGEPEQKPEPPVYEKKPFYLVVSKLDNTVTIYTLDLNGEYTVPLRAMICSTGSGTFSKGVYDISRGRQSRWRALFGHVYGQYVTNISGNILFHSVPYRKNGDPSSLEWEEFDKLGTAASMGCVRLQVKDAKWVYENRDYIAAVEFTKTAGSPLERPTAPLISDNETCRGWDPTDPDPDNPWRTYDPAQEVKTVETPSGGTEENTAPTDGTAAEPAAPAENAVPAETTFVTVYPAA